MALAGVIAALGLAYPAFAQTVGGPDYDQAGQRVQQQAADEAARVAAPKVSLSAPPAPELGPYPVERPCFTISKFQVQGDLRHLPWVQKAADAFNGRCVGPKGLTYILRALQAEFLTRGLPTTRAYAPQQDLSSGILRIRIVPGVVARVKAPTARAARAWRFASPERQGDILDLDTLAQGLEQMRRIPKRDVDVQIAPGSDPGQSDLVLKVKEAPLISGTVEVNNLSGETTGRWEGTASLTGVNLLGINDLWTLNYNSKLASTSLPANSAGSGGSLSLPYGWWTFTLNGSDFGYGQTVAGQVQNIETTGSVREIDASAERVIHRNRDSKTSLRLKVERRWGRSYIDDVEIGLQRQDLTDYEVALLDRRSLLGATFNTSAAFRQGVPWLGAQSDPAGQPSSLPTARYRIETLDTSVQAPIKWGVLTGYNGEIRAQWSDTTLFGSDQFAVGGPYTVRGFDSDRALLGKSGWFLRNELTAKGPLPLLQPYVFADAGQVCTARHWLLGAGAGLRAAWKGLTLDAYAAAPLSYVGTGLRPQLGIRLGYGF